MWIGGIAGALFSLCFSGALGAPPVSDELARFILFMSWPALYLSIDILGITCIPFLILVQTLYCGIVGMAVACGLIWFSFYCAKSQRMNEQPRRMGPA